MVAEVQVGVAKASTKESSICLLVVQSRPGRRPVQVIDAEKSALQWLCADGVIERLMLPDEVSLEIILQRLTLGVLVFDSSEIEENIDIQKQTPVAYFS